MSSSSTVNYNSAGVLFAPRKIKPSVKKFIGDSLRGLVGEQVLLGDGRVLNGQNATDLIYKTLRNSEGGTNGTFAITARFVVEVSDTVNPITLSLQLDSDLLQGVSVTGIATDDSNISTSSISTFPMTDNGNGSFAFGPWVSSGNKQYYGFEVKLTPVNSANDASLHDEYFAIQSMSIVQNGNDLLNSAEVINGFAWSQYIVKALPPEFSTQVLKSLNGNDVFITHTQNISGASYRWAYCSPLGLATNDGSKFSPFDIKTAYKLVNSGSLDVLVMDGGGYTIEGEKPRDIFQISTDYLKVIAKDSVVIDTSFDLPLVSFSSVGAHYEVSYNEQNHFNKLTIGVGTATPKLIMNSLNKNFTEVASAADVDTTDFSFFWDNSAKKFLLRFDGVLTDDVHVPESGNLFIGENIGYFGTANIKMRGVQAAFLNIDNGEFYETYNTGTDTGNAAGEVYNIDDIDGQQVDDYVLKCQADAYNYHGSGHTDIFDCVAEYSKDDGVSHHDNCTSYIQGGNYDYSGKGGVIPAFGASVVCVGVTAKGNKLGDSPLAQAGNFGGFVCLSNDDDLVDTTMICIDCITDDNKHGFVSSGAMSNAVVCRDKSTNNLDSDIAALTWGGNSKNGRVDVIQSDSDTLNVYNKFKHK